MDCCQDKVGKRRDIWLQHSLNFLMTKPLNSSEGAIDCSTFPFLFFFHWFCRQKPIFAPSRVNATLNRDIYPKSELK
jgi:hypothetical protein